MCLDTLYRFIFNSDYPTDKIIYLEEGTVTLTPTSPDPQSYGRGTTALKNLPKERAPFIKGAVSFDNWQSAIPFGFLRTVGNGIVKDITTVSINYPGSTWDGRINITVDSSTNKNATAKFRVWGLWAENDTGLDANKNNAISKSKLAFSTDNNYPKLIKDGIAQGGTTVAHNLGKIPFIDAWYDRYFGFGTLMDMPKLVCDGAFGTTNGDYVWADENNVYFNDTFGDGHTYYYYRIYA